MAMLMNVLLDALTLPPQFSYRPYVPRKRKSVTATAKAVVTQSSNPVIVHGDGTLAWTIEAVFVNEYQVLYEVYMESAGLTLMTFKGYWGEEFEVYWDIFDPPSVRGRLFSLSGQFQVASVTTPQDASCYLAGFPAG